MLVLQKIRDEPVFNGNGCIFDFDSNNMINSFEFTIKITGPTNNTGNEDGESLTYLTNCWKTLEISLIDYEINLFLTGSSRCFNNVVGSKIFAISDTKFYALAVTLSFQGSSKLLQQLKLGFKGKIN